MPTYVGRGGTERWHKDPIEWPSRVPKGLVNGIIDVKPLRLKHLLRSPCDRPVEPQAESVPDCETLLQTCDDEKTSPCDGPVEPEPESVLDTATLLQMWEDEKAEKVKELMQSETSCREVSSEEDEQVLPPVEQVLPPVGRSPKRGRSPQPQELAYPPPTKHRRRERRRHPENTLEDDKRRPCNVLLRNLRFSQLSCKESFQCGRPVSQLVDQLLEGQVSLHAPFLRLTVFEEYDKNNRRVLRCIDNRRLLALRQYAEKSDQDGLMVDINLFSQNTLTEVQRYIHNCDQTPGFDIRPRKGNKGSRNNGNRKERRR